MVHTKFVLHILVLFRFDQTNVGPLETEREFGRYTFRTIVNNNFEDVVARPATV